MSSWNQCDETRPICNQCIKSRRHCSGYRSDFDILHRDETKATEVRARKAAAKKAAKRAAENGELVITFDSPSPKHALPTPSPTTASTSNSSPLELSFPVAAPTVPIDQQASCYFASHFIIVPGQNHSIGHLEYLLPLLKAESKASSPLQLAYSACALATMGNRMKSNNTDLLELAYMQHARALGAAHKALNEPRERNSDATLATVMMLSMFEVCTYHHSNWEHVADFSGLENNRFKGDRPSRLAVSYRGSCEHCQISGSGAAENQEFDSSVQCRPHGCCKLNARSGSGKGTGSDTSRSLVHYPQEPPLPWASIGGCQKV